jgi:hypothetical protein
MAKAFKVLTCIAVALVLVGCGKRIPEPDRCVSCEGVLYCVNYDPNKSLACPPIVPIERQI